MKTAPELAVTLSFDLLRHLREESRRLDVPLEWLIAGLVADTMSEGQELIPLAASA